jgi:hypothetical protein
MPFSSLARSNSLPISVAILEHILLSSPYDLRMVLYAGTGDPEEHENLLSCWYVARSDIFLGLNPVPGLVLTQPRREGTVQA